MYEVECVIGWPALVQDSDSERARYAAAFVSMLMSADQYLLDEIFQTCSEMSVGPIRTSLYKASS